AGCGCRPSRHTGVPAPSGEQACGGGDDGNSKGAASRGRVKSQLNYATSGGFVRFGGTGSDWNADKRQLWAAHMPPLWQTATTGGASALQMAARVAVERSQLVRGAQ